MNNQIIWTRSTGNRDIRFPPVFGPTINLVEPPEDLTTPDWVDPDKNDKLVEAVY